MNETNIQNILIHLFFIITRFNFIIYAEQNEFIIHCFPVDATDIQTDNVSVYLQNPSYSRYVLPISLESLVSIKEQTVY